MICRTRATSSPSRSLPIPSVAMGGSTIISTLPGRMCQERGESTRREPRMVIGTMGAPPFREAHKRAPLADVVHRLQQPPRVGVDVGAADGQVAGALQVPAEKRNRKER